MRKVYGYKISVVWNFYLKGVLIIGSGLNDFLRKPSFLLNFLKILRVFIDGVRTTTCFQANNFWWARRFAERCVRFATKRI